MSALALRPVLESDIPALNAIHAHYVQHTVSTFMLTPLDATAALAKYHSLRAAGLPYIVALNSHTGAPIGYAYCTGFRGAKGGYRHTLELSIFCHPNQGAGTALLTRLIDVLRAPQEWSAEWIDGSWRTDAGRARVLIACMSLDETAAKGGWALKEWYERFGFEMVGHLKGVGNKFERWIDTVYLQLAI